MKLSYSWERLTWKRYAITTAIVTIAVYIWVARNGGRDFGLRIFVLGVALWTLTFLVGCRAFIDTETGMFVRERLLFGRFRIGAVRLPLSEFIAVAINRYEDPEDNLVSFSVCLKQRSGELRRISHFQMWGARDSHQRCPDAERVAQELAEATRLPIKAMDYTKAYKLFPWQKPAPVEKIDKRFEPPRSSAE